MTLQDVTDFVCQHFPIAMTWDQDKLENWISWSAEHGFLFEAISEGVLVGIAIARPANDDDLESRSSHDEQGHYVFLDLVIAPTRQIQQALGLAMVGRFGNREHVAYRRKGKLKIRPYHKARAALLRT